jgi:hypothetical protein
LRIAIVMQQPLECSAKVIAVFLQPIEPLRLIDPCQLRFAALTRP